MPDAIRLVQDLIETVVFGNGWLALGGLAAVCLLTVFVRVGRGIQV